LAAFFAAFLVAYFIDWFSLTSRFAIKRSQCDSYIRLFEIKVKRKIRSRCHCEAFRARNHLKGEMFLRKTRAARAFRLPWIIAPR
jgi:hypothetical protein